MLVRIAKRQRVKIIAHFLEKMLFFFGNEIERDGRGPNGRHIGRKAYATVSNDDGCDALICFTYEGRVLYQSSVVMRMRIDKSGRQSQSGAVDFLGFSVFNGSFDADDTLSRYSNVSDKSGRAASVDYFRMAKDKVFFLGQGHFYGRFISMEGGKETGLFL